MKGNVEKICVTTMFPPSIIGWGLFGSSDHMEYCIYSGINLPMEGKLYVEFLWWTGKKWSTIKSKRKIYRDKQQADQVLEKITAVMKSENMIRQSNRMDI